jgi:hypothetical protein
LLGLSLMLQQGSEQELQKTSFINTQIRSKYKSQKLIQLAVRPVSIQ